MGVFIPAFTPKVVLRTRCSMLNADRHLTQYADRTLPLFFLLVHLIRRITIAVIIYMGNIAPVENSAVVWAQT